MKWKFVTSKGIETKGNSDYQMDEYGNILQRSGGVNPKACQNCSRPFTSNVIQDEVRQNVNKYKCKKCKFESLRSDESVLHTATNKKHELEIVKDSKVVGFKNTLSGLLPMIQHTKDDCIILCSECNAVD